MNGHRTALLRWCLILAGMAGLLICTTGCSSLRMPWASNAGLPPQWEPDVSSDTK